MSSDRKSWLDSWRRVRVPSQKTLARRLHEVEAWEVVDEPKLSPLAEMREYLANTELRPMRKGERPPIEFRDPVQQSDFERYAAKYWYMMRVPV
jgi:hypothetical protein